MLKSIKLKNYKSFGNLEADFTTSLGKPKKLIMIYGENGSGKSNLISAFFFLKNTFNSLSFQEEAYKMVENYGLPIDNDEALKSFLKLTRSNMTYEISDNKMIDSQDNMSIEINYVYHDDKEAIYKVEFNDKQVVYESLYCQLEKNLVKTFEITSDNVYFNNNLFLSENYRKEIEEKTHKYFGKHTFLAIVFNETRLSNEKYIHDNVANSFLDALKELYDYSVWYKPAKGAEGFIKTTEIMKDILQGSIPMNIKEQLINTEEALSSYFVSLYSDIKGIHYECKEENNRINYCLYFDKLINGKIRSIPYHLESTGTIKLAKLFPYIFACLRKETVFFDEMDSGIHDILMNQLIMNLQEQLNGQLIITTHNTMLLNNIDPEYSYVINVDVDGNKTLNCVKDFGRIQGNHNVTTRYLRGVFGGIPQPGYIDLKEIVLHKGGKNSAS